MNEFIVFLATYLIAGLLIVLGFQLFKKPSTQGEVIILRILGIEFTQTSARGGILVALGVLIVLFQLYSYYFS